ncbi:hypothetical protein [Bradyrhizobium brasilense]|uniref:hypothetical protein n=1 Tax=Bradyrhizobium brasilense TaxID=1419277 RepID=UPI001E4566D5|nr:hypothetical protein [Bradyrhizobium brasilense]MCC8968923.1 hypothetical protein [Bradyrhizobium brasilense]
MEVDMPLSPEILAIDWAETGDLVAEDGAPMLARLQAAVARIVDRTPVDERAAAFPSRFVPTIVSADREAFDQMRTAAEAGSNGQYNGRDLPGIVMLLELNAAGRPVIPPGGFSEWQRRIIDNTPQAPVFSQRNDGGGRKFGLYERTSEPAAGEVRFVSDVTGNGRAPVLRKPNLLGAPFLVLYLAILLFTYVVGTVMWTGRSAAEAHALLRGQITRGSDKFAADLKKSKICDANAANAVACQKFDGWSQDIRTNKCVPTAPPPAGAPIQPLEKECAVAWRLALLAADSSGGTVEWILSSIFGSHVRGMANSTGELSLGLQMAGMMLAITLLVMAAGLGLKNHVLGLWINAQNRMSLARAQVSVWTLTILGGYGILSLFNVAFLGVGDKDLFPAMNQTLFLALGISFVSPMASKLILKAKEGDTQLSLAEGGLRREGDVQRFTGGMIAPSPLVKNPSPAYATVMDFFTGEEAGNANEIDISRVQNLIITAILVVAYAGLLFARVRNIPGASVVSALNTGNPLFPAMPDVSDSFAALLGLSHATYLVAKASQKPPKGDQ